MTQKNIMLLCGGSGSEHEISLISANYLLSLLDTIDDFKTVKVIMQDGKFLLDNIEGSFAPGGHFKTVDNKVDFKIDCVVPCLHGYPGETGDIQAFFEILNIPFVGCDKEASINAFNKVTTKLYLTAYGINNTPYCIIDKDNEVNEKKALEFFDKYNDVFVKAASQGSSVGCYHVTKKDELISFVKEAFKYSNSVIIEKNIEHRELEVAAYTLDGTLHVTTPGEVIIPKDVFYTYDEKYSTTSGTQTTIEPDLDPKIVERIREIARETFIKMNLRHLSRIDFFLTPEGEIIVNEINTFPGMTPISLFPKLLEHNGHQMTDFLKYVINDAMEHP